MRRILLWGFMILCTGSLVCAQAERNKRYIAVQSAAVKDSTGFFSKDVGTLALGAEVTITLEDGKWTKVQTDALSGWVASASLSARRVIASGSAITASEVALAGKGFSAEVETEYKKNGVDYSIVDFMEKIAIPVNDLLNFVTEGRLSRGE